MNPEHQAAIQSASQSDEALKALFAKWLGSKSNPNGEMLNAYRNAQRALKSAWGNERAVWEVLDGLEGDLKRIVDRSMLAAARAGYEQAERDIELYGLPAIEFSYDKKLALAWKGVYQSQTQQLEIAHRTKLINKETAIGLLAAAPVQREGAKWLANSVQLSNNSTMRKSFLRGGINEGEYLRQAVAALDERTTNCCLRVQGQIVGVDEDFTLSGTPRFATRMRGPPFHFY